ncbi:MAG: RNA polymerase sigma factor [Planctomycetaceae bacterium]
MSQKEPESPASLQQPFDHQKATTGHSAANREMIEAACVQWEGDLKIFLAGVLQDRHLAEDAFQKTVIRAIETSRAGRQDSLRGWLFQVALNEARQIRREIRRENVQRQKLADQAGAAEIAGQFGRSNDLKWMVDAVLVSDDLAIAIRRSLAKLPADQREVVRRRIYEGQGFAEIAADMKLPLGTVLTWMRRALLRLKEDSELRELWVN